MVDVVIMVTATPVSDQPAFVNVVATVHYAEVFRVRIENRPICVVAAMDAAYTHALSHWIDLQKEEKANEQGTDTDNSDAGSSVSSKPFGSYTHH